MPASPRDQRPSVGAPAFDLVLRAAADLSRVDRAYDAEVLVSALLGSVYAIAGGDRGAAVDDFVAGLRRHLAPRRTPDATLLRAALGSLARSPGRRRPASRTAPWVACLGTAQPTGAYASVDEYGDQTSYVATFEYPDHAAGGPEHAVVALVDHNLGYVCDLVVTAPAAEVLSTLDPAPVEPAVLRAEVERHLAATDRLPRLPTEESLVTDRALALSRLRLLPHRPDGAPEPMSGPQRAALLERFRVAPESQRLRGGATAVFCLELIFEYAESRPDRDPLRWSPVAVDLFLLDWVPRRALLDADDIGTLPTVLSAWVRWAGRVSGQSPKAVAATVAAIAGMRGQFAAAVAADRRGPAAQAVAQLLAEGVDPADETAVAEWLAVYNARTGT
jgi:hypothetical protein